MDTAPLPAGWTEAELEWESLQEEAGQAWRAGQIEGATAKWEEAQRLAASHFPDEDPRRATSLANRGAGLRALGDVEGGDELLQRACALWQTNGPWVEGLPPDQRARSSLFHLRLERKHRESYVAAAKRRHRAIAAEGWQALCALRDSRPATDRLDLWHATKSRGYPPLRRLQAASWLIAPTP